MKNPNSPTPFKEEAEIDASILRWIQDYTKIEVNGVAHKRLDFVVKTLIESAKREWHKELFERIKKHLIVQDSVAPEAPQKKGK